MTMDEILYLEPDEEITSVIDKIKQAKSNRLSLVVPREATLLQSVVNLKLLVKEATKSNKEIILVTSDKIGRNLASQVGLTVYDSIKSNRPIFQPPAALPKEQELIEIDMRKAEEPESKPKGVQVHHFQEERKAYWKEQIKPISKPPWQPAKPIREINWSKTRKLLWPMLGVIIFLILAGLYLIFPLVKVVIKVKAENFSQVFEVQVSGDSQANLDNKIFAGEMINLSQEKEEKFISNGKKNLGGKATGTLTLYNYWDSGAQNLDKGTKFSSSSRTFLSKAEVTIPGTSIKGGNIVPGTASVEIEAENPGEEYNVKAGRFTIVGLPAVQQEKIYGQTNKDLSGGFSKEVTVVSQNDFDQAKEKLAKELSSDLKSQLTDKSDGKEVLEKAIQNETVEIKSSANVDAEANDFTLIIKQRLRVIVFDKNAFDKFVFQIAEQQIPYDKMISLGPNDAIVSSVKETKYDQNILLLQTNVEAKISSRVDTEKVQRDLLGKNLTQAQSYLNNLSGVTGFEIQFKPSWWLKRISNFNRNLQIELEYLEETPENNISPSPVLSPSPEVSP